jgi:hypothetical protein
MVGNTGTGNGSFTVSLPDTTPPTVSNIQPTGTITTSNTTIIAYYSDSESGIDTATVSVMLDGSPVSGCSIGVSSVSCSVSGLSEGSHTIDVSVDDMAGNTGTGNGSFTYTAAAACTALFTDINNATIAVYSDAGLSAAVCQYDTLSPNTDYYMKVTDYSTDLNGNGTNKNQLQLKDLNNSNVNFGDGSSTVSFSQQGGSNPYTYVATFRTPSSAGVYSAEAQIQDKNNNKLQPKGWSLRVGSTSAYVKTFSDSGYSNMTDSYNAGDTVYIEVYDPGLTDSTNMSSSNSKVDVGDFHGNKTNPSVTVSRVSARTYRMSFTLPGTSGDKGLKAEWRDNNNNRVAVAELLIAVN